MRLLVIEDEPQLNESLCQFLQQQGYVVDSALDGKEGLYLAEEHPYDLAIVDLGLPEIDGIELIQQVRQKQLLKHCQSLQAS